MTTGVPSDAVTWNRAKGSGVLPSAAKLLTVIVAVSCAPALPGASG